MADDTQVWSARVLWQKKLENNYQNNSRPSEPLESGQVSGSSRISRQGCWGKTLFPWYWVLNAVHLAAEMRCHFIKTSVESGTLQLKTFLEPNSQRNSDQCQQTIYWNLASKTLPNCGKDSWVKYTQHSANWKPSGNQSLHWNFQIPISNVENWEELPGTRASIQSQKPNGIHRSSSIWD